MRYLLLPILLLALSCPLWAQDTATALIQSELIEAPDSVAEGRLVSILLPPNLPFTVEPPPANKLSFIDETTGKRAYLIFEAKAPGYKITIDYAVVHPTDEELAKAPTVPDPKDEKQVEAFKEYFRRLRTDEIYKDSHFVKVGEPTPPVPPVPPVPPPGPPTDPQARKVYDAAIANHLPASECKTVADNMNAVVTQAAATPMTLEEIQKEIKKRNEPITSGKPSWDAWEKALAGIFTVTTKEQAIEAYGKIAAGLEGVK